ncbi:MAG TPA: ribonuclease P protein component [Fimbriimonadales bacterium]|nr:ribonuclease P protein component [Fimbriimonadales bacterium]
MKSRTLKKRQEFERLFQQGKVFDTPYLRVLWLPGEGRFAVIPVRAIGSIARRNTIKRRWREALRTMLQEVPSNRDMLFLIKKSGENLRGEHLREALRAILNQLRN